MPVSFSLPQPPCFCKGPTIIGFPVGLPPLMFPPSYPCRNIISQPAMAPFPRMSMTSSRPASSKPKKIIRIKDPQTGHDVTEEILSSALGVDRVKSETLIDPPARRAPPPLMKRIPVIMPCTQACSCMCVPVPQPHSYGCPQCRNDFDFEGEHRNDVMNEMRHKDRLIENRNRDDRPRTACRCLSCLETSSGDTKLERKQYIYSRKFLLKLREHPASYVEPKGLPDFILPDLNDLNSEGGSGDYMWRKVHK